MTTLELLQSGLLGALLATQMPTTTATTQVQPHQRAVTVDDEPRGIVRRYDGVEYVVTDVGLDFDGPYPLVGPGHIVLRKGDDIMLLGADANIGVMHGRIIDGKFAYKLKNR